MSPLPRPPPRRRNQYARFVPITLRWMDNDVFGHVNNAHYYSMIDTAVCESLASAGIPQSPGAQHILVAAEGGCRFLSEISFPGRVEAGLRIARLGTSCVRYEVGIFRDGSDTAAAEGFLVHVCVDSTARRPAELPETWRAALARITVEP